MLVCTYHIVVAKDVYFSWYLIGRYFRKSTISIRKVMTINLLKHTTNKTEIHKEHLFSQGAVNKVLHFFENTEYSKSPSLLTPIYFSTRVTYLLIAMSPSRVKQCILLLVLIWHA